MAPRALLLSPDDQAVSAITGVLEELSVNCERPMDGASAAQKLHSQVFDLVLVDCDNLPAAKLIFDVCRRAHAGVSIPIAIVDGRAGLPTAFRLGAELILTKPVAKDQARTTIRTAVIRLKKEEPARPVPPAEPIPAIAAPAPPLEQNRALAASAGASTSTAKPADAPALAMSAAPAASAPIVPATASTTAETQTFWEAPAASKNPSQAPPVRKPSDDPVLAELEKAESELEKPIFSSYEVQKKAGQGRGLQMGVLVLALAGGAIYTAWLYLPQFRDLIQPQVGHVLKLVGMSAPSKTATSARIVPQAAPAPPASTPSPVASVRSTTPAETNGANPAPPATAAAQPAAHSASAAAPGPGGILAVVDTKADKLKADAISAPATLPDVPDAVVLSSKGAERRLIHQVQPAFPAEARSKNIEGTIVLKTLVSASGAVEAVYLVEGNPALAEAAISAVRQWRYRPYIRDGKAKAFQTIVLVDFQ